jgi:hypothetical protein
MSETESNPQRPMSTYSGRTQKKSNAWKIGVLLGLVVIAVLVWFFVFKDELKTQTMNNATMYTVTHGTKNIELGSLIHSGILKGIKLTAKAKEQGWGNQCSSFHLNIMRDGKSIAGISQKLGRNKEYKSFSLDPKVTPGTLVQKGDSVRMTINGKWRGCATWIKDIVVEVTVLG